MMGFLLRKTCTCLLFFYNLSIFLDLDKPQLNSTSLVKINETLSRVNVTEATLLRVTCSATSLPQASFTWSKYQDSGYSLNGKDLFFNRIERNNNGTYDCLARNSVGTKRSVDLIVDVQCKSTHICFYQSSFFCLSFFIVASPLLLFGLINLDE